ncbi:hypothetical protein TCAL_01471 [Tigriopus californicus]|uniref:Uncharacterized protein n=1 Tax=Tigriopus californicus TaxID=6832 RepID=A0A553N6S4_TIGCA|nr:coiled-coil domain-containing protein 13-like [Tigriopus californicus]TRY61144.1 hypothetical protein TCAL_01471 [Tigriopus californicus]|eukprot:TCALIF_01471-PA protein Name:"Protein of unknown function" AED:0.00 eAED:0.00 QI:292/1/1/1/1/1/2/137/469
MWRRLFRCSMSYSPDFEDDTDQSSSSSPSSTSSQPSSSSLDDSDQIISYNDKAEEKAPSGSRRDQHDRRDESTSRPRLIRQDTFTVKEGEEFIPQSNRTRPVTPNIRSQAGIRNILGGTKGNANALPDEIKNYLTNHFQMIKQENEDLRHSLKQKSKQLDQIADEHHKCRYLERDLGKCEDKLKQMSTQLEKEKAKTKMLTRQMKANENGDGGGDTGIVFYGVPPPNKANHERTTPESNESDDNKMEKKLRILKERIESQELQIQHLKQILTRELGSSEAVENAIHSNRTSWQGREEQIRKLEDALASMKTLLRESRSATSNRSEAEQDWRIREVRAKCQMAEVERDRLNEYTKVLLSRLKTAEGRGSKAEQVLREERRKSARLEHLLEKAHIEIRDSDSGKSSISSRNGASPAQIMRHGEDRHELVEEIEILTRELSDVRSLREQDLEMYQKLALDTRKVMESMAPMN